MKKTYEERARESLLALARAQGMTPGQIELVMASDAIGRLVCGDGAPTWAEVNAVRAMEAREGRRWDWVNRRWESLPQVEA